MDSEHWEISIVEAGVTGMHGTILLYENVINVLRPRVVCDDEGTLCYLHQDDRAAPEMIIGLQTLSLEELA